MRRSRFITAAQADEAYAALGRMTLKRLPVARTAPHFVDSVRLDVEGLLDTVADADAWIRSGMRVETTIHPVLQQIVETTLAEQREYLREWGARHASIVILDRETRDVLAYAGNIDYDDPDAGNVDMARSPRQTGSSFKPIVYAADMMATGANSGTFILDGPLGFRGEPKNYEGGYKGWMRIKNALGSSRNVPAVRAFFDAGGEENVLSVAAAMGVVSPLEMREKSLLFDPWFSFGWPAALGAAEVPLVELVQAYATIAEGGVFMPLRVVDRIEGQDGETLLAMPRGVGNQAVDPEVANEIDAILRDPLVRPKGFWRSMLTIPGLDTAAKTGTSNLCLKRDARGRCASYGVNNVWIVGYDERIVVGVWAGNADNAPLAPTADGLTVAAPVWRIVLERANGLPVSVR
jgi:penicillin-binding protein 1C